MRLQNDSDNNNEVDDKADDEEATAIIQLLVSLAGRLLVRSVGWSLVELTYG